MAVKSKDENGKLILEIDNGDLEKLNQVMDKWSFKDHQALLRFSISILILSEDESISIKMNGSQRSITPAADLLKDREASDDN